MMVNILLPVANERLFSQEPIHFLSYPNLVLFIAIILVGQVFISGFYPAFTISRINIFKALKNKTGTWKAGIARKALVIVQNAVAYSFIICAFIMILQVRFLKTRISALAVRRWYCFQCPIQRK